MIRKFIRLKVFIARTSTYLAMVNAGMILFLLLSNLKERGIIAFDIDKFFIPILILGFISLIVGGWIEIKFFKGQQEELKQIFELSPPFVEMKEKIDKLYEVQFKDG